MKITEEVRAYAASKGLETVEAIEAGLQEKSKEFVEAGGEVYR
jgi:phosphomethylpyrimidine synthase